MLFVPPNIFEPLAGLKMLLVLPVLLPNPVEELLPKPVEFWLDAVFPNILPEVLLLPNPVLAG